LIDVNSHNNAFGTLDLDFRDYEVGATSAFPLDEETAAFFELHRSGNTEIRCLTVIAPCVLKEPTLVLRRAI